MGLGIDRFWFGCDECETLRPTGNVWEVAEGHLSRKIGLTYEAEMQCLTFYTQYFQKHFLLSKFLIYIDIPLECYSVGLVDKSTLVQVMAWCLTASSHYLNQCWLWVVPPGHKELILYVLKCCSLKDENHFICDFLSESQLLTSSIQGQNNYTLSWRTF